MQFGPIFKANKTFFQGTLISTFLCTPIFFLVQVDIPTGDFSELFIPKDFYSERYLFRKVIRNDVKSLFRKAARKGGHLDLRFYFSRNWKILLGKCFLFFFFFSPSNFGYVTFVNCGHLIFLLLPDLKIL